MFSGVMAWQDVAQDSEVQKKKKWADAESCLPGRRRINVSTAEVLRQAEGGFGLEGASADKRWLGGDAWFGGVESAVMLKKKLNVDSTYIVKNNTYLFPKATLGKILRARHGERPAGNWVTMSIEIAGVKLLAMCYAWSKKGFSYFITTVGSAAAGDQSYTTYFEDDNGVVSSRDIPRPSICSYLYEKLPVIDEHNRQRQNLLGLERCWPTDSCWFRLLTTLVGQCVVDYHRVCKIKFPAMYRDISVSRFSYMLVGKIPLTAVAASAGARAEAELQARSPRKIAGHQGVTPTKQGSCYVCRRYYGLKYFKTAYHCAKCGEPVCNVDRTKCDTRRAQTCLQEHHTSLLASVRCLEKPNTKRRHPAHTFMGWDKPALGRKKQKKKAY